MAAGPPRAHRGPGQGPLLRLSKRRAARDRASAGTRSSSTATPLLSPATSPRRPAPLPWSVAPQRILPGKPSREGRRNTPAEFVSRPGRCPAGRPGLRRRLGRPDDFGWSSGGISASRGRSAPTGSHHRPGAPGVTESVSCIALSSEYPRRPRPAVGDRLDRRQDRRPARRHRTDRVGPDLRRVKRSVGGSEESEPLRRPACPCCPAAPISAGYLCRTNRGASCETTVREPTLRALAERALASRRGHSVQESCRGGA